MTGAASVSVLEVGGIKIIGDGPGNGVVYHFAADSKQELLSNLVFGMMNQAATWSSDVTSTPSINRTPLITLAR